MATWLTSPFESNESGNLVMGTIRRDVDKFRKDPKFKYRIEVSWSYQPDAKGMPDEATSEQMEEVENALSEVFTKDPVAVLTGIYTGEGVRDWEFYTLSLHIFQRKFNEALAPFPAHPRSFSATEDPSWEDYAQALSAAEAADSDEE